MKKILIIYHSQSGKTRKLADAIVTGVKLENNNEVRLKPALKSTLEDLLWCDAVIFGTPENFGSMSGGLKYFFDQTYYPVKEKSSLNIPYAIFISCGNNGSGAVHQIEQIAQGYPLKKTINALIIKGEIGEIDIEKAIEFGQTFAAGINLGIF